MMQEELPKPLYQVNPPPPEEIWNKTQLTEMRYLATKLGFWNDVKAYTEALKRIKEKEKQNG